MDRRRVDAQKRCSESTDPPLFAANRDTRYRFRFTNRSSESWTSGLRKHPSVAIALERSVSSAYSWLKGLDPKKYHPHALRHCFATHATITGCLLRQFPSCLDTRTCQRLSVIPRCRRLAWFKATMRLTRTHKSCGLNPPPSAEANLSLAPCCLRKRRGQPSTPNKPRMFAIQRNELFC